MSWKDFESDETLFINDKVTKYGVIKDNNTLTSILSNTKKGLTIIIPFGLLVMLIVVSSIVFGVLFAIFLSIIGFILYGMLLNRFVFNSRKNAKLSAEQKRMGIYNSGRWNDIIVDRETGQKFNVTGGVKGIRSSFLITWDNSPILNNSLNVERNIVENELTPFISHISSLGMGFIKRDIEIQNDLSPQLLNTIVKTRNSRNESVKIKMELQNKVYSSIELNSQQKYQTVLEVVSDSRAGTFDFKTSLQSSIDSYLSQSEVLKNVHIMNYDEIQEFTRNETRDETIDLSIIGRNNESIQIFKYIDILSIYDKNGKEYNYSDLVRGGDNHFDDLISEKSKEELPEREKSSYTQRNERVSSTRSPQGDWGSSDFDKIL